MTIGGWWQNTKHFIYGVLAMIACIAAGAGFVIVVDKYIPPYALPQAEIRKVCDHYVRLLEDADNLTDVTRAGIVIDRLNCSMRSRVRLRESGPAP